MLVTRLSRALLNAADSPPERILSSLLEAVTSVIPSKMASLWKLNNLSKTLSIYVRKNYLPPHDKTGEYVQELENSFIGSNLEDIKGRRFIDIKSVQGSLSWKLHHAKRRVLDLNLKRMILIPIPNLDKNEQEGFAIDAILNLYIPDEFEFSEELAEIITEQLSLAISRARLHSRAQLTKDIIQAYEQRGYKDIGSVLYPIINNILKKYIQYEGCSVFVWDPLYNRFALAQTTGIEGKPKKSEVFYYLGEGLTGTIAETKESILIKDLNNIENNKLKQEYTHKWREATDHGGKSFMGIPIMSPSNPREMVGIIRFTNRLNPLAPVVDYFSQEDFDLVKHVCNFFALYMEFEQSAKVNTAFAMKMSHEMMTPATAIKGSAERLLRKWRDADFPQEQIDTYLKAIYNHAELEIALTRTIEYVWKGSSGAPKIKRYYISKHNLKNDIIMPSKKLVIPICVNEGLLFDNIVIHGVFPTIYIDKYAFEQVFFNLLTNAIKYRLRTRPVKFNATIEGKEIENYQIPNHNTGPLSIHETAEPNYLQQRGYLINIRDDGEGINAEEKDKIFLFGYRRKGIEKTDVRGLGIGLTLAKRVLEDFYCSIWVDHLSNPTVFSIFIPEKLLSPTYVNEEDWQTK